MRISKILLSLIAVAGLIVAVGCADEAVRDSGVAKGNKKSAPASNAAPAPAASAPA
jgi:hypothetical protein